MLRGLFCFVFFMSFILYSVISHAVNPMVVVSIDGLRPDAIKKAQAQTLIELIHGGTSFSHAYTVRPSITLPAHTSMVTGLDPQVHGLLWNNYQPAYGPVRFPTILELAKNTGLKTALIIAKEKLAHLNRPGSTDYFLRTEKEGKEVATAFAAYVKQAGLPDLSFLHLPDPDTAGHSSMWNTPAYFRGVRAADDALAHIISTAEQASRTGQITLIVTADHGGFGFSHFVDIDLNNRVPLIVTGPGIDKNVIKEEEVHNYDIAATVLSYFGIAAPRNWISKPLPIFLLNDYPARPASRIHESLPPLDY